MIHFENIYTSRTRVYIIRIPCLLEYSRKYSIRTSEVKYEYFACMPDKLNNY